jgi:hypothetical protein
MAHLKLTKISCAPLTLISLRIARFASTATLRDDFFTEEG